ncbi:MAG: hypothetical protein HZA54_13840 [Planctomycetes bacterium]|nr:hypothetical protein [Planctomycetota bacterium]
MNASTIRPVWPITAALGCLLLTSCAPPLGRPAASPPPAPPRVAPDATPADRALAHLAARLDRDRRAFEVYTDAFAPGNHFVCPSTFWVPGALSPVRVDALGSDPAQGYATCIRNEFRVGPPGLADWGGCYFLNGTLGESGPEPNWGTLPASGYDLTGAERLVFRARGERGGETVSFFVGGVGRDARTGLPRSDLPYAETFHARTLGYVGLDRTWQEYTIDLTGADLRYCLAGLGWATDVAHAPWGAVFYVDDVRFEGAGGVFDARAAAPRLLSSYDTRPPAAVPQPGDSLGFDLTHRNVALTQDNALAALAFLARGTSDDLARACTIADALVYALDHDPELGDGRLRNAYQAGDLTVPPGWEVNGKPGTVRLPGWWDPLAADGAGAWDSDPWWLGSDAATQGWAILALLECARRTGPEEPYLACAQRLGDWVEKSCARAAGGFSSGTLAWAALKPEVRPVRDDSRSTVTNLVLAAAFARLGRATGEEKWGALSERALAWVQEMHPAGADLWWLGDDGAGGATTVPVQSPTQAALLLWWAGNDPRHEPVRGTLEAAQRRFGLRCGGCGLRGYDLDGDQDGLAVAATAQMALALRAHGVRGECESLLAGLSALQGSPESDGGGLPEACRAGVTTGETLLLAPELAVPGSLSGRVSASATAWFALAGYGRNPFAGVPAQ